MNINWDDVTAFASEANNVADEAANAILDHVNDHFEPSNFGGEGSPKLRMARIYLAAHIGSLIGRGGGAVGPVVSSSAGRLSRTYAVIQSANAGSYDSTSYGSLLKALIATTPARLGTAV